MADPTLPERMPVAAEDAIRAVKSFRSWEPVEMYQALRAALQQPHEYRDAPTMSGSGAHAQQGKPDRQR
jgi:hypothetical protein